MYRHIDISYSHSYILRPNQAVGQENLQFLSIDEKVYNQADIKPNFQVILTNGSRESRGGGYIAIYAMFPVIA